MASVMMVRCLGSHQSVGWRAIASAHCCHCQRVFASWSQRRSWTADTRISGSWTLWIPGRNVSSTSQDSWGFCFFSFGCCFSLKFHQVIVSFVKEVKFPLLLQQELDGKVVVAIWPSRFIFYSSSTAPQSFLRSVYFYSIISRQYSAY